MRIDTTPEEGLASRAWPAAAALTPGRSLGRIPPKSKRSTGARDSLEAAGSRGHPYSEKHFGGKVEEVRKPSDMGFAEFPLPIEYV